jgi:hypothetical protein
VSDRCPDLITVNAEGVLYRYSVSIIGIQILRERLVFNTVALALIGGVLAVLGAAIIWAIATNLHQGEAFRNKLGEQLSGLRLARALRRFGIDPSRYLHTQPIVDIEEHMQRCRACKEVTECEHALDQHKPPEDFAFCPNYPELDHLRAKRHSERAAETT